MRSGLRTLALVVLGMAVATQNASAARSLGESDQGSSSHAATAYTVTFVGSGTYTITQSYKPGNCAQNSTTKITLGWTTTWKVGLPDSGTLESVDGTPPGSIGAFSQSGTIGGGCGTPTTRCTGIVKPGATPAPSFSGTIGERQDVFTAQAVGGAIDLAASVPHCPSPQPGYDLYVLGTYLPKALQATTFTVPAATLATGAGGSATVHNATPAVPFDCDNQQPEAAKSTCSEGMSWTGTVTFAGDAQGPPPRSGPALSPQEKSAAAASEEEYNKSLEAADKQYEALECHHVEEGTKYACAAVGAMRIYAYNMGLDAAAVHADPPDPNYGKIAKPAHLSGRHIQGPQFAAFNTLTDNFAEVGAVESALLTSINRRSGALKAGDSGAAEAQMAAIKEYAARLAALLGAEAALVGPAGAPFATVHFSGTTAPISLDFTTTLAAAAEMEKAMHALAD